MDVLSCKRTRRICSRLLFIAGLVATIGCGGGGSSDDSTSSTGGETGSTGVGKVATIPSTDLSDYDYSNQSSSNIAVGKSAEDGRLGGDSGAYCHAKSLKKEVIRHSKQIQLDKCYALAMEKGGLYSITDGVPVIVKVIMPDDFDDFEQAGSSEQSEQQGSSGQGGSEQQQPPSTKAAKGEGEFNCANEKGALGQVILMKIVQSGSTLNIDMCEGPEGAEALINESIFTISGDTYTADATHSDEFCGQRETGNFKITISGVKSVTDGIATLDSTEGEVTATGEFKGHFGTGTISFHAIQAARLNTISGGFTANFTDPMSGYTNAFEDTIYAKFGGTSNTGSANMHFSGSFPAASVAELCGRGDLGSFSNPCYADFSKDLGITINAANASSIKVCPKITASTGAFAGDELSKTGSCTQDHTDIESFKIASDGESASVILDALSAHYKPVKAFNLSTINLANVNPQLSNRWDCKGEPTVTVDPKNQGLLNEAVTPTGTKAIDGSALQSAIAVCQALDKELRESDNIGDFDCYKQEQAESHETDVGVQETLTDAEKDFIPKPCQGPPVLEPQACKDYCDKNPSECFNGATEGMPPACVEAKQTPESCPDYCAKNPC